MRRSRERRLFQANPYLSVFLARVNEPCLDILALSVFQFWKCDLRCFITSYLRFSAFQSKKQNTKSILCKIHMLIKGPAGSSALLLIRHPG